MFIVVLLLLAAGVAYFFWKEHDTVRRFEKGDSALEILKRRYAAGDMSKEEFEARRRDLEES